MECIRGSCLYILLAFVNRRRKRETLESHATSDFCQLKGPAVKIEELLVHRTAERCNAASEEPSRSTREVRTIPAQDWPISRRVIVASVICLYTFVVYAASAIYIIGIPNVMTEFDVSEQEALMGLSLYVLAYGIGPLIWAPCSELDFIGRSPVYGLTFMAFLVISVLVAMVQTWTGFLILRFLQGFFGSPCLANGGASMHDLFKGWTVSYSMAVWIAAAYCGPALGPLISSHLVPGHGWRMGMWEIVWMAAPTVVLVLLLPETYGPALEVQSDKRRSILSQQHLGPAQDQIKNKLRLVFNAIGDAVLKPIQIMLQDPAVHIANIYTTFVYSTYYTFFDAFPQVYLSAYQFTVGGLGLAFTSIALGCVLGGAAYCAYIKRGVDKQALREPLLSHEECLRPALVACVLPPLGLFLFGWSARSSIHWIVSLVGVTVYAAGVYIILQCLSLYLPRIYPRYAASLFAANDLCRSCTAAALIHAGVPLYGRLGVSRGISVLGSISVFGIPGMWFIYWKGPALRAKSRFVAEA